MLWAAAFSFLRFSSRQKMTSCLTILPPCYPNHERMYLKTMSPNKHFSSKFLCQLLCHNRKKCYISPTAIMLSMRLKPSSTRWFSSSGIQRQWHTCTQVLKAERDESPTRYFRVEHWMTDRIFVSYGKHPCIHATGYIVGPLKKKKSQTVC